MTLGLDKDTVGKAVTCAGVSAGVTGMAYSFSTPVTIPALGRSVPLWSAAAAASGIASVGSDLALANLFPAWEKSMFSENTNMLLTAAVMGGGANAAVLNAHDPSILRDMWGGLFPAVAIGAGCEVAGGYIYHKVLSPMVATM